MNVCVSVGMPIYNGEPWLGSAIDSILSQTLGDLELIICDNASSDGTETICRDYATQDKRVRYYKNEANVGGPLNHNLVFTRAIGRYFKWASCNDICDPRLLAECVSILDAHPDVVLCYPRTRWIKGDVVTDGDKNLALLEDDASSRYARFLASVRLNDFMQGVIRTAALRNTHLMGNYFSSDTNLMAELTLYGKFYKLSEYLYYRRMDPSSATAAQENAELIKHYHPSGTRLMLFQNWRMHLSRFPGVWRAPQSVKCKLTVCKHLIRQMWWARPHLVADIQQATTALHKRGRARLPV